MIKKKTPILMVSIVGTIVLTLIAINMTQILSRPDAIQEIEAPNEEALKKVNERPVADVLPEGVLKQEMQRSFGTEGDQAAVAAANPETPSIQLPSTKSFKPTFEPNTTSAHWYDDDSYQKVNANKDTGKRADPK